MLNALLGSLEPLEPSRRDRALVTRGFTLADQTHLGEIRDSGELYISHPVAIACSMAAKMKRLGVLDILSILVALLHDSRETILDASDKTREQKREDLGRLDAELLSLVPDSPLYYELVTITHMKMGRRHQTDHQYAEHMLGAGDWRVLFVKCEDWKHNLSTLKHRPPKKQRKKVRFIKIRYLRFVARLETIISAHVTAGELPPAWLSLGKLLRNDLRSTLAKQEKRVSSLPKP